MVLEYLLNENNVATTKTKLFQNVTKFYTICDKCNNDLFGGNYDKELEFYEWNCKSNWFKYQHHFG